ncbi:MAG: globin [Bacteroidales bacterium]|nr:globin [Bacteroidales bacterium]
MITTNFQITTEFDGQLPRVVLPNPDFFNYLGEEKFRSLISRHYDILTESSVSHLFPKSKEALEMAKSRSADFFIQLMGGPDYYKQNRGEPMMRKRHMPFKIDMDARIVWLQSYQMALNEIEGVPAHFVQSYWTYLDKFSLWMINS